MNHKLLKVISLVSASVLTMGMLAGCGASQQTSTEQTGNTSPSNVIVMGTNAEFEPFEYRDGLEVVG